MGTLSSDVSDSAYYRITNFLVKEAKSVDDFDNPDIFTFCLNGAMFREHISERGDQELKKNSRLVPYDVTGVKGQRCPCVQCCWTRSAAEADKHER